MPNYYNILDNVPTVTHSAGALTANAVVVGAGNGDSAVLSSLGANGQVLTSNGAGALPSWQSGATMPPASNLLVNSTARVATRGAVSIVTNLGATRAIGSVDNCALWASAGAVSAGTIAQTTASIAGTSGYAARAAGATLTGAAVLSFAVRMEARDAVEYKNKTGSFQIAVAHDVGVNVNYTVIIKKANAADNWGAMTTISTSAATAVATATGTVLKFENVAMGDCSNGLEIEVQAACGAVITKNFDFTEWALTIGATAPVFANSSYEKDIEACSRYLIIVDALPYWQGACVTSASNCYLSPLWFKPALRVQPSGVITPAMSSFTLRNSRTTLSGNPASIGIAVNGASFMAILVNGDGVNPVLSSGDNVTLSGGWLIITGAELF